MKIKAWTIKISRTTNRPEMEIKNKTFLISAQMNRWRRRRHKLPQRVSSLIAMEITINNKLTRTSADNGRREAKEAAVNQELVKILLSKV